MLMDNSMPVVLIQTTCCTGARDDGRFVHPATVGGASSMRVAVASALEGDRPETARPQPAACYGGRNCHILCIRNGLCIVSNESDRLHHAPRDARPREPEHSGRSR